MKRAWLLSLLITILCLLSIQSPVYGQYCAAGSWTPNESYIRRVTVGTISNLSFYDATGYQNHTDKSTSMDLNTSYTITVLNGNAFIGDDCVAWVDWNQNNVFETAEQYSVPTTTISTFTGTITPPPGAALGYTRMRVRMYAGANAPASPCGNHTYGEVEDYTIYVNDPSNPPPNCVSLSGPADGAADLCDSTVMLSWSSGGGSVNGYKLNFGTDNPPSNIEDMTDLGNVLSYDPGNLLPNTTYYWQILPYNNNSDAYNCAIRSFTTAPELQAGITPAPVVACPGTDLLLDGNPSGGSGVYSHNWEGDIAPITGQTGLRNPVFNTNKDSAYNLTYTATDANGCVAVDDITIPVTKGIVAAYPYRQNFENETTCDSICSSACTLKGDTTVGWINYFGEIDWVVDTGGTPTANTGPDKDHTVGDSTGRYAYLETSGGCTNSQAMLLSPCLDISNLNYPALSFWYHMYGSDMGELHVEINPGDGNWTTLHTLSGPQQTSSAESWQKVKIDLFSFKDVVQIRFRGVANAGDATDMAIDDIMIYDRPINDVGVVNALSGQRQLDLSDFTAQQEIAIQVANVGIDTQKNIPVTYRINGGPAVWDTISSVIPPEASVSFTFSQPANLSIATPYQLTAWTSLPFDGDVSNDTLNVEIYIPEPVKVPITIFENADSTLYDYPVLLHINTVDLIGQERMTADGSDLQFLTCDDTELPYWIESGLNTDSTRIWVKIPDLPASDSITVYMISGAGIPDFSGSNNRTAVFDWYEDFDTDRWTHAGSDIYVDTSNSWLYIHTDRNITDDYSYFKTPVPQDFEMKLRFYPESESNNATAFIGVTDNPAGTENTLDDLVSFYFYGGSSGVCSNGPTYRANNKDNGAGVASDYYCGSLDQWYNIYVFKTDDSVRFQLWNDAESVKYFETSFSGAPADSLKYLYAGGRNTGNNGHDFIGYLDFFRLRKYVSPEPTVRIDTPLPSVRLTVTEDTICTGESVDFAASPGFENYAFFINGSSVQDGTGNTFTTSALDHEDEVVVQLTDAYGCAHASNMLDMTVFALPVAAYNTEVNTLTATFSNASEMSTSYLWEFDDSETSTDPDPDHTYAAAGTYEVCLTASNKCGDNRYCDSVTVCNLPEAAFTDTAVSLTVQLTDLSSDAAGWHWTFGDGKFSEKQHPVYTYEKEGAYEVCLTAANACGDKDTRCDSINVVTTGIAELDASAINIYPNPSGGRFTIEVDNPAKLHSIEVTNVLGERIFYQTNEQRQGRHEVDLSDYADGLYFVKLRATPQASNSFVVRKLLINKTN